MLSGKKAMEKVKWEVCTWWIKSNEGRTNRLGLRDQEAKDRPWAAGIGHMKSKRTWVMKTMSTESRTGLEQVTMRCHEHLVDRQTKDMEVEHASTSVSHAWWCMHDDLPFWSQTRCGQFSCLGLKTIDDRFDWFGPQNRRVPDRWTWDGISKLVSKRSKVEKASGPLDVREKTWTVITYILGGIWVVCLMKGKLGKLENNHVPICIRDG